jgi:Tfp pilus assembly protein PilF
MSTVLEPVFLLYEQSRYPQAIESLRQILRDDPQNATAQSLLALNFLKLKQYRAATETAQQAIATEPDLPFAHYVLSEVYYERNLYPEAEAAIQEALKLNPTHASFYGRLAAIYLDQERWQDTLNTTEIGLRFDPENTTCLTLRSLSLSKLNRLDEAQDAIQQTIEQEPNSAIAHSSQGWLWLKQHRYPEALQAFKAALQIDPTLEWARQGVIKALKARNPLYRGFLQYTFWMSKLDERGRWVVIIGMMLLFRVLRVIAKSDATLTLILAPILVLYALSMWLTWAMEPLTTLILRFDAYGRLVLSEEEIQSSNWVGSLLLLMVIGIGMALFTLNPFWLGLIGAAALLVIPVSSIHRCDRGWPRQTMTLYTLSLLGLGVITGIGLILMPSSLLPKVSGSLFLIGLILSAWLANWLVQRTPKLQ